MQKVEDMHPFVPFFLEENFKKMGANFVAATNWTENVVVDGLLVTGQNPQSSTKTAEELVKLLEIPPHHAAAEQQKAPHKSNAAGGTSNPTPVNDEVKKLADEIKPVVERKAGRKFKLWKPLQFTSQVVAGVNFFIKVEVDAGFVHIRG